MEKITFFAVKDVKESLLKNLKSTQSRYKKLANCKAGVFYRLFLPLNSINNKIRVKGSHKL